MRAFILVLLIFAIAFPVAVLVRVGPTPSPHPSIAEMLCYFVVIAFLACIVTSKDDS